MFGNVEELSALPILRFCAYAFELRKVILSDRYD